MLGWGLMESEGWVWGLVVIFERKGWVGYNVVQNICYSYDIFYLILRMAKGLMYCGGDWQDSFCITFENNNTANLYKP